MTPYELIVAERRRQIAKWGDQLNKDDWTWLAVLTEEAGEVARAVLETHYDHPSYRLTVQDIADELVQVAAVAVAWLEAIDQR